MNIKENLTNWADLVLICPWESEICLTRASQCIIVCHQFHPLIIQLNTTELKLLLVRQQKINNWAEEHTSDDK